MNSIQGHKEVIQNLFKSIQSKTLNPSLLFYGSPSVGKKLVALEVVKKLICSSTDSACHRQLENKQTPLFAFY